jgi:hypothetical protein
MTVATQNTRFLPADAQMNYTDDLQGTLFAATDPVTEGVPGGKTSDFRNGPCEAQAVPNSQLPGAGS